MTREQAIAWAGSEAAGLKVLEIVERWEAEGLEPRVHLTRRGNLRIEVGIVLSEEEESCDTERPAEPEAR